MIHPGEKLEIVRSIRFTIRRWNLIMALARQRGMGPCTFAQRLIGHGLRVELNALDPGFRESVRNIVQEHKVNLAKSEVLN